MQDLDLTFDTDPTVQKTPAAAPSNTPPPDATEEETPPPTEDE